MRDEDGNFATSFVERNAPSLRAPPAVHCIVRSRRYSLCTMSMTFDIPSDVQAGVAGISDLDLRVALYLRHEARLEVIRRQRHSTQARELAADAVREAETDKAAGFDWDDSFTQLRQAQQDISARL